MNQPVGADADINMDSLIKCHYFSYFYDRLALDYLNYF